MKLKKSGGPGGVREAAGRANRYWPL